MDLFDGASTDSLSFLSFLEDHNAPTSDALKNTDASGDSIPQEFHSTNVESSVEEAPVVAHHGMGANFAVFNDSVFSHPLHVSSLSNSSTANNFSVSTDVQTTSSITDGFFNHDNSVVPFMPQNGQAIANDGALHYCNTNAGSGTSVATAPSCIRSDNLETLNQHYGAGSCQNCIVLKKKLTKSMEWNKFFQKNLIISKKLREAANEMDLVLQREEEQRRRFLELQLAYDNRTREWEDQQEQLIQLYKEEMPLRERLCKLEKQNEVLSQDLKDCRRDRDALEFTKEQYQFRIDSLMQRMNPATSELTEKKLKLRTSELRRMRIDMEAKDREIHNLTTFVDSQKQYYERLGKKCLWGLKWVAKLAGLRAGEELSVLDESGVQRLKNALRETESVMSEQFLSFRSKAETILKDRRLELSSLPCFEEWIDDFDQKSSSSFDIKIKDDLSNEGNAKNSETSYASDRSSNEESKVKLDSIVLFDSSSVAMGKSSNGKTIKKTKTDSRKTVKKKSTSVKELSMKKAGEMIEKMLLTDNPDDSSEKDFVAPMTTKLEMPSTNVKNKSEIELNKSLISTTSAAVKENVESDSDSDDFIECEPSISPVVSHSPTSSNAVHLTNEHSLSIVSAEGDSRLLSPSISAKSGSLNKDSSKSLFGDLTDSEDEALSLTESRVFTTSNESKSASNTVSNQNEIKKPLNNIGSKGQHAPIGRTIHGIAKVSRVFDRAIVSGTSDKGKFGRSGPLNLVKLGSSKPCDNKQRVKEIGQLMKNSLKSKQNLLSSASNAETTAATCYTSSKIKTQLQNLEVSLKQDSGQKTKPSYMSSSSDSDNNHDDDSHSRSSKLCENYKKTANENQYQPAPLLVSDDKSASLEKSNKCIEDESRKPSSLSNGTLELHNLKPSSNGTNLILDDLAMSTDSEAEESTNECSAFSDDMRIHNRHKRTSSLNYNRSRKDSTASVLSDLNLSSDASSERSPEKTTPSSYVKLQRTLGAGCKSSAAVSMFDDSFDDVVYGSSEKNSSNCVTEHMALNKHSINLDDLNSNSVANYAQASISEKKNVDATSVSDFVGNSCKQVENVIIGKTALSNKSPEHHSVSEFVHVDSKTKVENSGLALKACELSHSKLYNNSGQTQIQENKRCRIRTRSSCLTQEIALKQKKSWIPHSSKSDALSNPCISTATNKSGSSKMSNEGSGAKNLVPVRLNNRRVIVPKTLSSPEFDPTRRITRTRRQLAVRKLKSEHTSDNSQPPLVAAPDALSATSFTQDPIVESATDDTYVPDISPENVNDNVAEDVCSGLVQECSVTISRAKLDFNLGASQLENLVEIKKTPPKTCIDKLLVSMSADTNNGQEIANLVKISPQRDYNIVDEDKGSLQKQLKPVINCLKIISENQNNPNNYENYNATKKNVEKRDEASENNCCGQADIHNDLTSCNECLMKCPKIKKNTSNMSTDAKRIESETSNSLVPDTALNSDSSIVANKHTLSTSVSSSLAKSNDSSILLPLEKIAKRTYSTTDGTFNSEIVCNEQQSYDKNQPEMLSPFNDSSQLRTDKFIGQENVELLSRVDKRLSSDSRSDLSNCSDAVPSITFEESSSDNENSDFCELNITVDDFSGAVPCAEEFSSENNFVLNVEQQLTSDEFSCDISSEKTVSEQFDIRNEAATSSMVGNEMTKKIQLFTRASSSASISDKGILVKPLRMAENHANVKKKLSNGIFKILSITKVCDSIQADAREKFTSAMTEDDFEKFVDNNSNTHNSDLSSEKSNKRRSVVRKKFLGDFSEKIVTTEDLFGEDLSSSSDEDNEFESNKNELNTVCVPLRSNKHPEPVFTGRDKNSVANRVNGVKSNKKGSILDDILSLNTESKDTSKNVAGNKSHFVSKALLTPSQLEELARRRASSQNNCRVGNFTSRNFFNRQTATRRTVLPVRNKLRRMPNFSKPKNLASASKAEVSKMFRSKRNDSHYNLLKKHGRECSDFSLTGTSEENGMNDNSGASSDEQPIPKRTPGKRASVIYSSSSDSEDDESMVQSRRDHQVYDGVNRNTAICDLVDKVNDCQVDSVENQTDKTINENNLKKKEEFVATPHKCAETDVEVNSAKTKTLPDIQSLISKISRNKPQKKTSAILLDKLFNQKSGMHKCTVQRKLSDHNLIETRTKSDTKYNIGQKTAKTVIRSSSFDIPSVDYSGSQDNNDHFLDEENSSCSTLSKSTFISSVEEKTAAVDNSKSTVDEKKSSPEASLNLTDSCDEEPGLEIDFEEELEVSLRSEDTADLMTQSNKFTVANKRKRESNATESTESNKKPKLCSENIDVDHDSSNTENQLPFFSYFGRDLLSDEPALSEDIEKLALSTPTASRSPKKAENSLGFTTFVVESIGKELKESFILAQQEYYKLLHNAIGDKIGSKTWRSGIDCLIQMLNEKKKAHGNLSIEVLLKPLTNAIIFHVIRTDALRDLAPGAKTLCPELYKLFMLMKVLEHNLGLSANRTLEELVIVTCHSIVLTTGVLTSDVTLTPGVLASLSAFHTAACCCSHAANQPQKARLERARVFLVTLLMRHPGAVHSALLVSVFLSRMLLLRSVKYRSMTGVELVFRWIVYHGTWIGRDSVKQELKSVMKEKLAYEPPNEEPLLLIQNMLNTLLHTVHHKKNISFDTPQNTKTTLLGLEILACWLGKTWVVHELLPLLTIFLACKSNVSLTRLQQLVKDIIGAVLNRLNFNRNELLDLLEKFQETTDLPLPAKFDARKLRPDQSRRVNICSSASDAIEQMIHSADN